MLASPPVSEGATCVVDSSDIEFHSQIAAIAQVYARPANAVNTQAGSLEYRESTRVKNQVKRTLGGRLSGFCRLGSLDRNRQGCSECSNSYHDDD